MLDDLKYIHERDSQDALGVAAKQWQQLEHDFGVDWRPTGKILNLVVAGMGGSALAAVMAQSWPRPSVPFEVVRDYRAPAYADVGTLFVASSYSGNTEETLSALEQAEQQGCQIAVIASGGKLAEAAEKHGYPLYRLPGGLQPRHAVFYNFAAVVQLLIGAGLIPSERGGELKRAADWLESTTSSWLPTVATKDNRAKQIALECIGKSVVVYAGPVMWPAAYKWKIDFNENAKHVAWTNQFPEFNHNEFMGWSKQPVDKPYTVIELRSNLEHPQVQKRFVVSERMLSGLRPSPIVVEPQGDGVIEQLLWVITLGDFVSLYTALLNGLDPTPVELIEKLKLALAS